MSDLKELRIGSRQSLLALWQANEVIRLLSVRNPDMRLDIKIHKEESSGDKILDKHLSQLAAANQGVFTKELEVGLVHGSFNIAVHSLKDMPTSLPKGLILAGIGAREDPRDAIVLSPKYLGKVSKLSELDFNAVIGTSSLRRQAILLNLYPQFRIASIRGNLQTRYDRLQNMKVPVSSLVTRSSGSAAGQPSGVAPFFASPNKDYPPSVGTPESDEVVPYDAILLASAGMKRLGWSEDLFIPLSVEEMPYGVGQGSLGLECREDDEESISFALSITHGPSAIRCLAERSFLNKLEGGCQVPIGVFTSLTPSSEPMPSVEKKRTDGQKHTYPDILCTLRLVAHIISPDGSERLSAELEKQVLVPMYPGNVDQDDEVSGVYTVSRAQWIRMQEDAREIGHAVADMLLEQGAERILGPLTSKRPITYGSAELPLDR